MIDRLMTDLERAVRTVLPELPFLGTYRYRVVKANPGDSRWHLQVVVDRGLPDMLPISIHPGMAGLDAQLTLGATVLVQFVEGRRDMPIITHFAPPDDAGWRPVTLTLDASGTVFVGPSAGMVELGSGTDTPADATGRLVRYGDNIAFPSPGPGPILPAVPGVTPVAKVSA